MVTTSLRTHVSRLKPKSITYRSLKNFDVAAFCDTLKSDLDCENILIDTNSSFDSLLYTFVKCLDKYAPLKKKQIRGNQCSCMNKNLCQAIMKRSSLKSKYNKNKNKLSRDN